MAQQVIDLGTAPDARDGDKLRVAFLKANGNFAELYPLLSAVQALQISSINATQAQAIAQAAVAQLTAGAPASLDTFLEAYNRFLSDENAVTALSALVGTKAPLDSAALTGSPTTTTPMTGDNSTRIANTAFVATAIAAALAGIGQGGGGSGPAKGSGTLIRAGLDDAAYLTAKSLYDAAAPVAWGNISGTYTPDMATFLSATATLTGNTTITNPANPKPGQAGELALTQDTTGSRLLTFGSAWKFVGGQPTASSQPGTVDVVSYRVFGAGLILCSYGKNFS